MQLHADDHDHVYVWVDDNDPTKALSPHFDYEDDADQWFKNQADVLKTGSCQLIRERIK